MAIYQPQCVLEGQADLGECPLWSVEEQCLYWIDIHEKYLNRFDPATGENRRWSLPEMPGSFVFREGGGIVIAMHDGFHAFDPATGAIEKLADAPYDRARFRFNDGRTDRQGRFWVGSMAIDFMDESGATLGAFHSFDGREIVERISPIEHANGTVFTPDGRTMFRSETVARKIFAYDLDPASGAVSNERLFATVPDHLGMPDGATIDSEGGYWTALPGGPDFGSVARFTPDGALDLVIELPVLIPTMPAFGGPDMSTLYVTSGRLEPLLGKQPSAQSGGLFAVDVPFKGVAETMFKPR